MKRFALILASIGIAMIILGLVTQYINNKCESIDKNTDFWVRNCDYK